jgi:hypothetical protein
LDDADEFAEEPHELGLVEPQAGDVVAGAVAKGSMLPRAR